MKISIKTGLVFLLWFASVNLFSQQFYYGHDLSSVNQWEDAGAVYKKNNAAKDVYQILADEGTNLIRIRLWYDPGWWQGVLNQPEGVKPTYNDFDDVKKSISRAKQKGMKVMLDIHYSDFWADPGRQLVPRSWIAASANVNVLADSVYRYTKRVLTTLDSENLMPDLVKVGNETNPGILCHIPQDNNSFEIKSTVSSSWSRHAVLFNSAIKSIRDVGATASINPKIVLHFSGNLSNQLWNYQNVINNGITDFDIMGISYYYAWHGGSISALESTLKTLKTKFPNYDVMVAEVGYLWSTTYWCDNANNIINTADPAYLPATPENQLKYMIDYTKAVKTAGGVGVVFWEPAQICTNIASPWGVGSSQEHVSFFDSSTGNFMENGGGKWTNPGNYTENNKCKVTFQVDMTGQDVSKGVYITGELSGWAFTAMEPVGNNLYSVRLELTPGDMLIYYFIRNNSWTNYQEYRETVPAACSDSHLKTGGWNGDRLIIVPKNDTIVSTIFSGCLTSSTKEIHQQNFQIFPNPATDRIIFLMKNGEEAKEISIYSLVGKKIKQMDVAGNALSVTGLPAGMYIISVKSNTESTYTTTLLKR